MQTIFTFANEFYEIINVVNTNIITKLYETHRIHKDFDSALKSSKQLNVKGLQNSAAAFFISSDNNFRSVPTIVVMNNEEEAAYMYNDFQSAENQRDVFFFPFSHKRSVIKNSETSVSPEFLLSKTEVLDKIKKLDNFVLITYPQAAAEKVISSYDLEQQTLNLAVNDNFNTDFIAEALDEYGFQRVDFVFQPGQYSQRGSIIDIYSYSNDNPYRIDFFGDQIESIRTFDVLDQLSISKVDKITIIPDICRTDEKINKISFFDFIPENSILWFNDFGYTKLEIEEYFNNKLVSDKDEPDVDLPQFLSVDEFEKSTSSKTIIDCGTMANGTKITFNIKPQPNFQKNFNLLADDIRQMKKSGYEVYITMLNEKQNIRLHDIFNSDSIKLNTTFNHVICTVYQGFIDNDLKLCCYTDHQIFDRYLKYRLKETEIRKGREAMTVSELNSLKPGDYVVHSDHGIGVFGGLETTEINGKPQEVIRLVYKDNDILFVSLHSLHKISKYKGSEGEQPKIYKLGSSAWSRLKQKTKSRVKDIAKDLIKLYAQRQHQKGFAFSPDSYLQQALEASFIYEDTPDQEKATAAVKNDMEQPVPMDRLICGDVGFGKTEIAIRAAFKAATDGKQVAVLVPTTILALQHYKTFSDRLKDLPCTVEYISRLRTTKEIKDIEKRLAEGTIDILIGTHKIVGKDVVFKDLGLLIIDEEQKFGVSVKEKLKQIKLNVDTLTLTATPIPRTLQFSLLGARDLSIINTPPPNRYPIVTEVHTFNNDIIRDAINYELDRNGQVFVIQNKIKDIYETENLINKLCPRANTIAAHGQMDGKKLEEIMLSFINEEIDVLISTTIIENGLDIPNANTIIVIDAQNYGLSALHQLRGRVGRSNKKAFCYLLAPPKDFLTPQARQRLKAIESFSELGSGFNIAMQDLDIRGAGNLLGGEQSGFISEIGMETYQKILDEAIIELREQEYQEMMETDKTVEQLDNEDNQKLQSALPDNLKFVTDCTIDTDMELLLPENYVENVTERVKIYRQLDNLKNEDELQNLAAKLEDRFGKIPKQTLQLFNVVRMRWQAINLGMERISLKGGKMICYFVSKENSPYFQTQIFSSILMYVQLHGNVCRMKQISGKPCIVIEKVNSPEYALKRLNEMIIKK